MLVKNKNCLLNIQIFVIVLKLHRIPGLVTKEQKITATVLEVKLLQDC